ncbi:MAG: hypothetical protein ACQEWV_11190 [Bacillota bacterium]
MKKASNRQLIKETEKDKNVTNVDYTLGNPKVSNNQEDAIRSEKLRYENADEIYE